MTARTPHQVPINQEIPPLIFSNFVSRGSEKHIFTCLNGVHTDNSRYSAECYKFHGTIFSTKLGQKCNIGLNVNDKFTLTLNCLPILWPNYPLPKCKAHLQAYTYIWIITVSAHQSNQDSLEKIHKAGTHT